jgi:hypothetical protein
MKHVVSGGGAPVRLTTAGVEGRCSGGTQREPHRRIMKTMSGIRSIGLAKWREGVEEGDSWTRLPLRE